MVPTVEAPHWFLRHTQVAADVARNLTARGMQVMAAPGESEHLDFVDRTVSYEEQLQVAGKAYLDWYMLSQVQK